MHMDRQGGVPFLPYGFPRSPRSSLSLNRAVQPNITTAEFFDKVLLTELVQLVHSDKQDTLIIIVIIKRFRERECVCVCVSKGSDMVLDTHTHI